ncbi:unnamed protein product [Candidula unifasciata]|uniref:Uncharacterized protein n=1 Tax=Candidula unifasciata TaxID=100452 RepID=A0A8S3YP07_9EUPU|nr:unnamed protein product [Candidula unifasciata]
MNLFLGGFYVLAVICALLYLATRAAVPAVNDVAFSIFQRTYLTVYLLAMAGDWLQGPHVYALYESYGMTTDQIDILFVAGFGSSMFVGTIVGSFADKYGRRTNCILYGVLYGAACITKVRFLCMSLCSSTVYVLMILYCACPYVAMLCKSSCSSAVYVLMFLYCVCPHRGFDSNLLGSIFSLGVLGNSVVAILAGLVAQKFADMFGYSLFEGAMYCFVLEWTPSLSAEYKPKVGAPGQLEEVHADIPHGHIFAAFMVSLMIGSSVFKLLCKFTSVESFMRGVLFVAALSLMTPIIFKGDQLIIFIGFLVFETCVGIFWPSMGTMRGRYVAEETRATTMNIFRVPLNFIVVIILLQHLNRDTIFKFCTFFLLVALACQQWLYVLCERLPKTSSLSEKAASLRTDSAQPPLLQQQQDKKMLLDDEEEMV